jgi:hypothetical protein
MLSLNFCTAVFIFTDTDIRVQGMFDISLKNQTWLPKFLKTHIGITSLYVFFPKNFVPVDLALAIQCRLYSFTLISHLISGLHLVSQINPIVVSTLNKRLIGAVITKVVSYKIS